jgi:hypothetical protein
LCRDIRDEWDIRDFGNQKGDLLPKGFYLFDHAILHYSKPTAIFYKLQFLKDCYKMFVAAKIVSAVLRKILFFQEKKHVTPICILLFFFVVFGCIDGVGNFFVC